MKILLYILLTVVAVFTTITGLLLAGDPGGGSLNLPPEFLQNTPFRSYFVPGLMLALIVGGINILAVYGNITRSSNRYSLSVIAGVLTFSWTFIQMILIQSFHWIHFLFLVAGILIVLLATQLKGRWAV